MVSKTNQIAHLIYIGEVKECEQSKETDQQKMVDSETKEKDGVRWYKNKMLFPLLISIILWGSINALYMTSLGNCPYSYDDPQICIGYFRKMYPVWVGETVLCGILWFLFTVLAIYGYIHRLWIAVALVNYFILFIVQSGNTMADHGGLNRTVLTITVTVLSLLMCCYLAFKKVYKCSKILFSMIFVLIGLLVWMYYLTFVKSSCKGWENGMANHSLSNEGGECKVLIPNLCELGIRDNWLDFTKFTHECPATRTYLNREMLNEKIRDRDSIKKLGYPRVEDYPDELRVDKDGYRNYVREQVIDMDDPEIPQEVKDNIEFTVDISDPDFHKLEIELKPNMTRAEEQKALREEVIAKEKKDGSYEHRIDKNVLILYIDNLSRAHFYRKMPKTAEWLSQFVDNQDGDLNTYQFFRYHSVFYNTIFSNNALYYGEVEDVNDTSQNMFDAYSRNGYMTGFFKDSCESTSNSIADPNMKLHHWDHFGGSVTCDTNYDDHDFTSLTVFEGKSSAVRRCFYSKNMHEYQIEYLKQFWAAYPENRKFFRTHFSEAHELTGELIKYADEDIRDLLQYFYEQGYLEDTFVTLLADHGAHALTLRFPAFPDNSRYIENYYPILIHLTKNDIPERSNFFLKENEQSFISSHDVYSGLKSIAENLPSHSKSVESYSYIREKVPSTHDCTGSSAYLAECWCSQDVEEMKSRSKARGIYYSVL